jgi:RNA polymerase sigma-70 factor (ECF subfamily)
MTPVKCFAYCVSVQRCDRFTISLFRSRGYLSIRAFDDGVRTAMYQPVLSKFVPNSDAGLHSGFSSANRSVLVRRSFDAEYVRGLTEGDPETAQHFTNYFGELLRIKLRSLWRSAQMTEDICQETFLRVLTALRVKHSLESPERLGAFVNSVCNNLLLELYRAQSRTQSVGFDAFDPADHQVSAESALVTEERKQQVRRVLENLSEKDRELLRMVFYDDVDKAEICRRFHIDRQYLRVLVHRAKARFKKGLLERHGESFRWQA